MAAVSVLGCSGAQDAGERRAPAGPAASGVHPVRFEQARRFWPEHGFVELVPPVRLPTTHDYRDHIQIWLRFPEDGQIEVRRLEEQGRYTLRSPPGTRTDRVEYIRYGVDDRWAATVIDVRGWRIGSHGPERFHVLRSTSAEPLAPLAGWSWPAGRERAQTIATRKLLHMVSTTRRPLDRPPLEGDALERFARLNECFRCHQPNKELDPTVDEAPIPRRATDASGCYALVMMLAREVPLSNARPVDLNVKDPYVRIRCGGEIVDFPPDTERPDCPEGSTPMAFRDIEEGLEDGDEHTRRVCKGRRYIHRHMSDEGRAAFAEAFRECGLSVPDGSP